MKNSSCLVPVATIACLTLFSHAGVKGANQWEVEEGGNGHWYQYIALDMRTCWEDSRDLAQSFGGHLGTITSPEENLFVQSVPGAPVPAGGGAVWLGGYQTASNQEPNEFTWVTGEPWGYTDFDEVNPSDDGGFEDFIAFNPPLDESWNDLGSCYQGGRLYILVEWPEGADCNSDGFVDIMQILTGEMADTDGNGLLDICQCPADLTGDGQLDFFDVSGFLVLFQLNDPVADFTGDGQLDFFDVSRFLTEYAAGCP